MYKMLLIIVLSLMVIPLINAEEIILTDIDDGIEIEVEDIEVEDQQSIIDLRIKKGRIIVFGAYDYRGSNGKVARSSFLPHVNYLIEYHAKLERENPCVGDGFGAAWWWSMVYGGANFGLTCYATAPGWCAGPLDVKTRGYYVLDPEANIRHHCDEMFSFYKRGIRGIRLCEYVFLPANPRDWNNGQFRRTHAKHKGFITRAYQKNILP